MNSKYFLVSQILDEGFGGAALFGGGFAVKAANREQEADVKNQNKRIYPNKR